MRRGSKLEIMGQNGLNSELSERPEALNNYKRNLRVSRRYVCILYNKMRVLNYCKPAQDWQRHQHFRAS
jgi:hypothetical protein